MTWLARILSRIEPAKPAREPDALRRMLAIAPHQPLPLALLKTAAQHPERFYARAELRKLLQQRARRALALRLAHQHGRIDPSK